MAWNEQLKQLTTTTKNLANNFNVIHEQLLENDKYVKQEVEILAEDYTLEQGVQDIKIAALETKIEKEITDRTKADDGLLRSMEIEIDIRAGNDKELRESIAKEVTDRQDADVALDTKIDNKITLDSLAQTNFDFIEGKVVQDGLQVYESNVPKGYAWQGNLNEYTLVFTVKPTKNTINTDTWNDYIRMYPADDINKRKVSVQDYKYLYINNSSDSNMFYTSEQIDKTVKFVCVTKSNGVRTMTIDGKFLDSSTDKDIIESYCIRRVADGVDILSLIVYNRQLTPQEIQHNISTLVNSPSINQLEVTGTDGSKMPLLLSSDEDHVEMATGRTLRQEYMGLLKQSGKDFTADAAGKIEVQNGLEARVISAEIKGNTVKNLGDKSNFTLNANSRFGVVTKGYQPNTKYTIFFNSDKTDSKIYLQEEADNSIWLKNIVIGVKQGVNTLTYTSNQDVNVRGLRFTGSGTPSFPINITDFVVLEGEYQVRPTQGTLPFGLSSTQAIIENNGMKYPLYEPTIQGKTRILKANKGTQNWTEISADEVRDTVIYDYKLESIGGDLGSVPSASDYVDRAGKVKMMNTKEIILEGKDNWLLTNNADGYYRYQLALDMTTSINNILADKVAVKPNGDVRSVFGFFRVGNTNYVYVDTTLSTPTLLNNYFTTNPTKVRYQSTTPQTIQLTDEEFKAYDKYKKVILMGKVGDVADTFALNEDGSGVYTQNTKEIVLNGSESWKLAEGATSNYFYITNTEKGSSCVADKLNTPQAVSVSNDEIGITCNSGTDIRVRLKVGKTQTIEQFKAQLQANPITVRYQLATPVVTPIPKHLVPTIQTNQINILEVDSAVKPSSFKATVPTAGNISKVYDLTLINSYTGVANANLLKSGDIELLLDVTVPSVFNQQLCMIPTELRPKVEATLLGFNGNTPIAITILPTGEVKCPTSITGKIKLKDAYER